MAKMIRLTEGDIKNMIKEVLHTLVITEDTEAGGDNKASTLTYAVREEDKDAVTHFKENSST